tara:strand:+ start:46 stop:204 length:159 start_codon:yes stop_codon:yes gene_type:complete
MEYIKQITFKKFLTLKQKLEKIVEDDEIPITKNTTIADLQDFIMKQMEELEN